MDNKERDRIMSDLTSLEDALGTVELYADSVTEAMNLLNDFREIVHCSECKNHNTKFCPVNKQYLDADWYCADGERW